MSTTQVSTCSPTDITDRCDVDPAAAAIVALELNLSGSSTRLTYCGHHWDHAPEALRALVVAMHDKRDEGIFDPPPVLG